MRRLVVVVAMAAAGCPPGRVLTEPLQPKPVASASASALPATAVSEPLPATIAVGPFFACAIKKGDGSVWCWGEGSAPIDVSVDPPKPHRVVGIPPMVELVAAGEVCGRTSGGAVWCWSSGEPRALKVPPTKRLTVGQPKFGVTQTGTVWHDSPSPTLVEGAVDVVAVVAGRIPEGHLTCARTKNQRTLCWGETKADLLAAIPPILAHSDAQEVPFLSKQSRLVFGSADEALCVLDPQGVTTCHDKAQTEALAGHRIDPGEGRLWFGHTSCFLESGAVWCWGGNGSGLVGDGTRRERLKPHKFSDGVSELALGKTFACLRKSDDAVACWGNNERGQLGDGGRGSQVVEVVPGLSDVVDLSAGGHRVCAVRSGGAVWCWGNNVDLLLDIDGRDVLRPRQVSFPPLRSVAVGERSICGVGLDDAVACRVVDKEVTKLVSILGVGKPRRIVAGVSSTCVLNQKAEVWCWKHSLHPSADDGHPARVALATGATDLRAGLDRMCALVKSRLVCWGNSNVNETSMPAVSPWIHAASAIAVSTTLGGDCAKVGVNWWCSTTPVYGNPFKKIDLAKDADDVFFGAHISQDYAKIGSLHCWRRATKVYCDHAPTVPVVDDAVQVAIGGYPAGAFACVRTSAGSVRCWGAVGEGQLGRGERCYSPSLVSVPF